MLNNRMKFERNEVANITALSVKNNETFDTITRNISEVCERFLQSADLIPEKEFLGWQINSDKEGRRQIFVFSSTGVKATQEDFNWIFQGCAIADGGTNDSFEPFYREAHRLYVLQYVEREEKYQDYHTNFIFDDQEEMKNKKYIENFLDAIGPLKATVRILVSSCEGGKGLILISLPDEMPLRLQTMLSMIFPDTVLREIKLSEEKKESVEWFSSKYLFRSMKNLLETLIFIKLNKEGAADNKTGFFTESIMDSDREHDYENGDQTFTPIEELELSVRSYHSLKRAGIYSVERLRTLKDEELYRIRNLGKKCINEIKGILSKTSVSSAPAQLTGGTYSEMLEELIGLKNIKEQIKRIKAFAKMKCDMEGVKKQTIPFVMNMAFTGNPGTAKTTVARIIAGIFFEIGILSSNKLVEVGRADLVARYEGQTADKVKSVFLKAKGKLLFIDEAYSLVESFEGAFGDEAIDAIVKEMENNRGDTIVIFAGYPDKMEKFFKRNPGLKSRIPFQICFEDYSVEEMIQITELEAKKRGFSISLQTRDKLKIICKEALKYSDMGNGRFCRNLVENAVINYASRVYSGNDEIINQDFMLIDEDFYCSDLTDKKRESFIIGFRA